MNLSILLPDGNLTNIELPADEASIDINELAIELIAAVGVMLVWFGLVLGDEMLDH
jgi:hypothetical protein